MLWNAKLSRNFFLCVCVCVTYAFNSAFAFHPLRSHKSGARCLPACILVCSFLICPIQWCQAAFAELHLPACLPLCAPWPQPLFIPTISFPFIMLVFQSSYVFSPEFHVLCLSWGMVFPINESLFLFVLCLKCVLLPQVVFLPLCSLFSKAGCPFHTWFQPAPLWDPLGQVAALFRTLVAKGSLPFKLKDHWGFLYRTLRGCEQALASFSCSEAPDFWLETGVANVLPWTEFHYSCVEALSPTVLVFGIGAFGKYLNRWDNRAGP